MDILVFIFFILITIGIGIYSGRSVQSEEDYLTAGRGTGLFSLVATLVMTEFNTSTLIGFSSVGSFAGIWGLAMPSVFLFGLLFYAFMVSKRWKEFNGYSSAGFFMERYNLHLGRVVSILLLIAMTGFTATYIKSLEFLFSPIFARIGWESWLITLLFTVFVLAITLNGGLVSVIRVDTWAFISVLILIPCIFIYSLIHSNTDYIEVPSIIPIHEGIRALPPAFILSLILLTMFTYISAPWYSQKIFSAKNSKVAFVSVLISAFLVFLLYGLPILSTTVYSKISVDGISPERVLPDILNTALPVGISGLAYAVFLVIGSTTLAGVWTAMNTMIVSDFLDHNRNQSKGISKNPRVGKYRSIGIIVLIALVTWVLSNVLVDSILDKLILANIPVLAISFSLLAGFYWKGANEFGAMLSIFVGVGWGIFSYLYWGTEGGYTIYWVFIGIPLVFGSGIFGSLLKR